MDNIKRKLNKHEIYFLIARFFLVFSTLSILVFSFEAIWILVFKLPEIDNFIFFFHLSISILVVYGTSEIMRSKESYNKDVIKFQTKDAFKKTFFMIFLLFVIAPLVIHSLFGDELRVYLESKGHM